MQKMRLVVRTAGITWIFSITLAFVYSVRLFWLMEIPHPGAITLRMSKTAGEVLYSSLYTILSGSMVAFIAIPLAAWSIGSVSWSLLKKYVYGFWLVLALFILASGNADGMILISGAGLIALWFLRNRSTSADSSQNNKPLRVVGRKSHIVAFMILIAITCILLLVLFFGHGTKVYAAEICAIYASACVCQGIKILVIRNHEVTLEAGL